MKRAALDLCIIPWLRGILCLNPGGGIWIFPPSREYDHLPSCTWKSAVEIVMFISLDSRTILETQTPCNKVWAKWTSGDGISQLEHVQLEQCFHHTWFVYWHVYTHKAYTEYFLLHKLPTALPIAWCPRTCTLCVCVPALETISVSSCCSGRFWIRLLGYVCESGLFDSTANLKADTWLRTAGA